MMTSYDKASKHLKEVVQESQENVQQFLQEARADGVGDGSSAEELAAATQIAEIEEENRTYSAIVEEMDYLTGEMKMFRDATGGWKTMMYRKDGTIDRAFLSKSSLKGWTTEEQVDILQEGIAAVIREEAELNERRLYESRLMQEECKRLLAEAGILHSNIRKGIIEGDPKAVKKMHEICFALFYAKNFNVLKSTIENTLLDIQKQQDANDAAIAAGALQLVRGSDVEADINGAASSSPTHKDRGLSTLSIFSNSVSRSRYHTHRHRSPGLSTRAPVPAYSIGAAGPLQQRPRSGVGSLSVSKSLSFLGEKSPSAPLNPTSSASSLLISLASPAGRPIQGLPLKVVN